MHGLRKQDLVASQLVKLQTCFYAARAIFAKDDRDWGIGLHDLIWEIAYWGTKKNISIQEVAN